MKVILDEVALAERIAQVIDRNFRSMIQGIETRHKADMDALRAGQQRRNSAQ